MTPTAPTPRQELSNDAKAIVAELKKISEGVERLSNLLVPQLVTHASDSLDRLIGIERAMVKEDGK